MPFEFPSFLKKNQIRHGEFEKIFFYEIRHGEFENFRDDAGNDTIQCYMVLYLSKRLNSNYLTFLRQVNIIIFEIQTRIV